MVTEKSTHKIKASSADSFTGEIYHDFKVQNSHLIKKKGSHSDCVYKADMKTRNYRRGK